SSEYPDATFHAVLPNQKGIPSTDACIRDIGFFRAPQESESPAPAGPDLPAPEPGKRIPSHNGHRRLENEMEARKGASQKAPRLPRGSWERQPWCPASDCGSKGPSPGAQ